MPLLTFIMCLLLAIIQDFEHNNPNIKYCPPVPSWDETYIRNLHHLLQRPTEAKGLSLPNGWIGLSEVSLLLQGEDLRLDRLITVIISTLVLHKKWLLPFMIMIYPFTHRILTRKDEWNISVQRKARCHLSPLTEAVFPSTHKDSDLFISPKNHSCREKSLTSLPLL